MYNYLLSFRYVPVISLLLLLTPAACCLAGIPEPPEPVPPVYTQLKNLHITTALVKEGKPNAVIVAPSSGLYKEPAKDIQLAVKEITGVTLQIVSDSSPEAEVPVKGNLIVLGNRSTNKAIGELYNRFYTLLDLRYPGPEGYVVRTLHNPFGDGNNVVFIGGSDTAGVESAAGAFIRKLDRAKTDRGTLTIDRLTEIKLGKGLIVPEDIREFETWEASEGYGSIGYFGWTSLSKRMAMYYMTGDEFHAREFIRLAFPDEQALKEIDDIDGERVENKDEPLSGFYHYNAHMAILFWDLIEESPVFTGEERLRVTNAFSKQLEHRKGEGIYGQTTPRTGVGSRHGQWAAISHYCLARYFQKDYPDPIWQHCILGAKNHFASLNDYAWVSGENDNLYWYNTAIAPVFTWLLLTGERTPVENGVLRELARGLDILLTGKDGDLSLRYASVGFLHKAAYLLKDGRYINFRERCNVDMDIFRLGQSYWPEGNLASEPPNDMVGKWSIFGLSEPAWKARQNGFRLEESFGFGSFRSAADASGDFILLDGLNGESRNPYHTFDILQLRIDDLTLLDGYRNQVLTSSDGLVEPKIAKNAALRYRNVVGQSAIAVGEVPDAAYCNWRRTLVQRTGQYALVVDDLTFRAESGNIEVQILWEHSREVQGTIPASGVLRLQPSENAPPSKRGQTYDICLSDAVETTTRGRVTTMQWFGETKENRRRIFFSLIAAGQDDPVTDPICVRVADNAAVLALPSPALAVTGEYDGAEGELVVLAVNHLFGKSLKSTGLESLFSSSVPVDVDWDFRSGRITLIAKEAAVINMALAYGIDIWMDGTMVALTKEEQDVYSVKVEAGSHVIDNVIPPPDLMKELTARLETLLTGGRKARLESAADIKSLPEVESPPLKEIFTAGFDGGITEIITVAVNDKNYIYAAEGKTIHVLSTGGEEVKTLHTDGDIRMLYWWPEHSLLLAGCVDEQVVAFDDEGNRTWVFTSVMDPAVYRAAKTYWFKSAPGHEGIHGLYSGVFLDGKSQLFVGSACTLEILDGNGELIKRMPQFWGPPATYAIIDAPGGSLNLLAARRITGVHRLGIINNMTLDPDPRGFNSVPPGHTYVGGWMSLNRNHLFYEDLDGDGVREVVSEINGTWNRVTVWNTDGEALYDASFGPGNRMPAVNMVDLDIADLDGDGRKEILAATAKKLVVALDCRCRKVWSRRLLSVPKVLKCVAPADAENPWVIVGCEDGTVVVYNEKGKIIRQGAVRGNPACIASLDSSASGAGVLIGTSEGNVTLFRVEE